MTCECIHGINWINSGRVLSKIVLRAISIGKAVPGHSNHSNGTVVDIWAISKTYEIPNSLHNQAA
jgi:hypothetical protein